MAIDEKIEFGKLRGVIFDLGGTLVTIENDPDFRKSQLYANFISLLEPDDPRLPLDEHVKTVSEFWHEFKRGYFERCEDFTIDEFNYNLLKHLGLKQSTVERIYKTMSDLIYDFEYNGTNIISGAMELLSFLRDNEYKIGLISNTAYDETQLRGMMRKVGIDDFFSVVLSSSQERCPKPNTRIFEKALSILGLKASEAIYIGDRPEYDSQGAVNSGMGWVIVDKETNLFDVLKLLEESRS